MHTYSSCSRAEMSSSKERTKKYRERLKENEEKYEVVKKKDRERKKKDYLKKKATQPEVLRAKEREKKRKQRKNMAELMHSFQMSCPMIKEVSSTKLSWMLLVRTFLSNRCTIGVMVSWLSV